MASGLLIFISADNEILVLPSETDTIRIHRAKENLDTIQKEILMYGEDNVASTKLETTLDDVLNAAIEQQKADTTSHTNDTSVEHVTAISDNDLAAKEYILDNNMSETMMDDTDKSVVDVPKKKIYVRKRSLCPIAGCTKNKKPMILSVHLLKHHKISKEERMYWLKNQ